MFNSVIIPDEKKLAAVKNCIIKDGLKKLQVIADFDGTLTSTHANGKQLTSQISILRSGGYLTPEYNEKAHALYNKYHIFENGTADTLEERKIMMEEWWSKHLNLLIETGLTKKVLQEIVDNDHVHLKPGAEKFITLLNKENIPLIILSANGIGDAIYMFFKKHSLLLPNIHIVTNSFIWDENDKAIDYNKPVIHSLNKNETSLINHPLFKLIEQRTNIILLGDNSGDAEMASGTKQENIIKIGFLNENASIDKLLPNFDIIITNNSYELVNKLVLEIENSVNNSI